MKKFVVMPVNKFKNVLPVEQVASGSEQTALKKYLLSHAVPNRGLIHITVKDIMNYQFEGLNQQQINNQIDFIVDTEKNIENGVIVNNKKSNAYKLL